MPSSSKLVNASDNFELRLVHYLGNHDATSSFVLNCETMIRDGDISSLLRTIIDESLALDVLFDNHKPINSFANAAGGVAEDGDEEDGVHAFSLICALLDGIEDENEIMKSLVNAIESYKGEENVEKKLKMLCGLYNLRHDGKDKCWILSRILNTCAFGGDDECVLSLLPDRDSTLGALLDKNNLQSLLHGLEKEGDLSQSDRRSLYTTASAVAGKVEAVCLSKDMEKEASTANGSMRRFLLKMLSTYASTDDVDKEAIDAATKAAVGAICDPVALFHEQRCIMSLPPVMALANDQGKILT